ncbi:MAG: hypothetical protein IJV22_08950 [Bacteroidales bacterium]|nr:hypothetical protein [Bacteroidales bacterium]
MHFGKHTKPPFGKYNAAERPISMPSLADRRIFLAAPFLIPLQCNALFLRSTSPIFLQR